MVMLKYTQAQVLAATLTDAFNKNHYSYSRACWEAHEIFRKKRMYPYAIYPEVHVINDKIVVTAVVTAERWVK